MPRKSTSLSLGDTALLCGSVGAIALLAGQTISDLYWKRALAREYDRVVRRNGRLGGFVMGSQKFEESALRWALTSVGRRMDYDGRYGAQCVDVFRVFCKEVVGIREYNTGSVSGAVNLVSDFANNGNIESKYFDLVKFTSIADLHNGDVVVYGATRSNKYGHVGVAVHVNGTVMMVAQDGFNTSTVCHLEAIKAERVCGILRVKDSIGTIC